MKQIKHTLQRLPLSSQSPFGFNVGKDSKGRISLTDIWKNFGGASKKDPGTWKTRESASEFIDYIVNSNPPEMGGLKAMVSKSGNNGGTYAHRQIALAYAKWLSHEAHEFVNNVFFERVAEEKNPDLILDRAVDTYKKKGKSDTWIGERLQGKATRINFTNSLASHGVKGNGYKECTNAIYEPLWHGDASIIRLKKGISKTANTRESMTTIELAAVRLAELIASENIEKSGIFGNQKCAIECKRTGRFVAQAVINSQKNL